MIRNLFILIIAVFVIGLFFTSCVPQKRIRYFQDKDTSASKFTVDTSYVAIIQPNDLLTIYVTSVSEESSKFFNFIATPDGLANSYVVDHYGNVQLPLVGEIHVSGLSTRAARDTVIHSLQKYLINPSVRLNIRNFKVTVLGEVKKPGVYPVQNEKITITEALALAEDLTPYSLRENIMVIREVDGRKEFGYVDLAGRDLFSSPYYNLHANDIVYVEPAKRKQLFTENYFKVFSWVVASISAVYLIYGLTKLN